jgi:hypothetical protein
MTRESKWELLAALRPAYRRASKAEKGRILDQFVLATGYHRKYAIRLLKHGPRKPADRARVGHTPYGIIVVQALTRIWEQSGYLCGKRLHAFLPLWIKALQRTGDLSLEPRVVQLLLSMSPATIDRKLKPARRRLKQRGRSTTRRGTWLKSQIPVRTFADWNDACPGFTEIDLVAHCGGSTRGEYLNTLSMVDVATQWFESRGVTYRSQRDVFAALDLLRHQFPFPLKGIDSDNDTVFINAHLVRYCHREGITFTRSRPYKKNDQAHVEQKNGSVIRNLIWYDRYEGLEATQALNDVYECLRLWVNFFQPSMKLVEKHRVGSKVHKKYDKPQTPYQRVEASPDVSEENKLALRQLFLTLDPLQLRKELDRRLDAFWDFAIR